MKRREVSLPQRAQISPFCMMKVIQNDKFLLSSAFQNQWCHDILHHIRTTAFFKPQKHQGRRRHTSKQTDAKINRIAVSKPTASSSHILAQLPVEDGRPSCRAVRRRRQHFKLRSFKAVQKPKLTARNIKDRFAFVKKYKNFIVNDCGKVLFRDETQVK